MLVSKSLSCEELVERETIAVLCFYVVNEAKWTPDHEQTYSVHERFWERM